MAFLHLFDAYIRDGAKAGLHFSDMAAHIGCHPVSLGHYCRRHAIERTRPKYRQRKDTRPNGPQDPSRVSRMAAMYRQGLTMAAIGKKFGVSRERVRVLLRASGVSKADGGRTKVVSDKRAAKADAYRYRILAKWGVSVEEHKQLRASGVLSAFESQRQHARIRDIPFLLTFQQWLGIWRASGKLDSRGLGKHRYCMSRLDDEGPYAAGNVVIQTNSENGREAVKKWRGKTKEFVGVFLLYPGREMAYQARLGRQNLGFYRTAQEAAAARAAAIGSRNA